MDQRNEIKNELIMIYKNENLSKQFEKIDAHLFKEFRCGSVDPKVKQKLDGVVDICMNTMKDGTGTGPFPKLQ